MTPPDAPDVLIIDDDETVLSSLARALTTEGFTVRTAPSATEGVLRFSVAEPDVVLLDLSMPGQNGWDTFEQLSRSAPLVPVVIITALPEQTEVARAAAVAALVEKPIDIPVLVDIIWDLLSEDATERLARLAHRAPATHVVRSRSGSPRRRH